MINLNSLDFDRVIYSVNEEKTKVVAVVVAKITKQFVWFACGDRFNRKTGCYEKGIFKKYTVTEQTSEDFFETREEAEKLLGETSVKLTEVFHKNTSIEELAASEGVLYARQCLNDVVALYNRSSEVEGRPVYFTKEEVADFQEEWEEKKQAMKTSVTVKVLEVKTAPLNSEPEENQQEGSFKAYEFPNNLVMVPGSSDPDWYFEGRENIEANGLDIVTDVLETEETKEFRIEDLYESIQTSTKYYEYSLPGKYIDF